MGLLVKTLDVLLPFRKAALQQMGAAADGADWIRSGVTRLKEATSRGTPGTGAPDTLDEARTLFTHAAERFGRNNPETLDIMETDLGRRHTVFVVAALVCFSLGVAGVILMVAEGFWSGIGLSMGIPMGGYATVSALRYGLRRYQVRLRALVPLPVYIRAAGGWWAAIVFGAK